MTRKVYGTNSQWYDKSMVRTVHGTNSLVIICSMPRWHANWKFTHWELAAVAAVINTTRDYRPWKPSVIVVARYVDIVALGCRQTSGVQRGVQLMQNYFLVQITVQNNNQRLMLKQHWNRNNILKHLDLSDLSLPKPVRSWGRGLITLLE